MPANHPEPAPPGTPAGPGRPDPVALLRSRSYLMLLVLAAILGVPISAAAYGFLALVSYLQEEIFTHLPHGLGFSSEPVWCRCQDRAPPSHAADGTRTCGQRRSHG